MKTQHLIPILFLAAFCTVSAQTNTPNTPALLSTNPAEPPGIRSVNEHLSGVSPYADEQSTIITLGIRDNSYFKAELITNVPCPLAFRIQNTGKTVLGIDKARDIFLTGYIHVLSKDGKQENASCSRFEWTETYGLVPHDLQPGDTFENKVVVNLLTFFPLIKDGDYQAWWTVGALKSNILRFKVIDGKLQMDKTEI